MNWTSKYGSVIATGYDIGTCDGMNEKGLVASLLFLPESIYSLPGDIRPAMGISIWTQYVLDNFATVREAVDELKRRLSGLTLPVCRMEDRNLLCTWPSPTKQAIRLCWNIWMES